jgi:hypothetical protein
MERSLERCEIQVCEAMCCHDGVYLLAGEEAYLDAIVTEFPEHFAAIETPHVIDAPAPNAIGISERKTAVRPHSYKQNDFPAHFPRTRCVFADASGLCVLETLARDLNIHPWTFKPSACWMFPLQIIAGEPAPPPAGAADDPAGSGPQYPGYSAYTHCGRVRASGRPWYEVLREEITFFEAASSVPVWALSGNTIQQIIALQRRSADIED